MADLMPVEFMKCRERTLADLSVGERVPIIATFLKIRADRSVWALPESTVIDGDFTRWKRIIFVTKLGDDTLEADISQVVRDGYLFDTSPPLFGELRVSRIVTDSPVDDSRSSALAREAESTENLEKLLSTMRDLLKRTPPDNLR